MGSGKSLFGVRAGVDVITHGQYWVTNQRLYEVGSDKCPEGAFVRIARHYCRTGSKRRIAQLAAAYESLYVYETDINEARRYRVPGKGEARALFTWDETHNDLNNRTYKDREQGLLEWATQLRKLGFVGFLLSQHHSNTDAQLRRIANGIVMLVNQREQHRVLGMRLLFLPPLFLAYWLPLAGVGIGPVTPWRVDRYPLTWHRKLYDTLDLYHGLAESDALGDVVHLPPGGRGRGAAAPDPAPQQVAGLGIVQSKSDLLSEPGGAERSEVGEDGPTVRSDTYPDTEATRAAFPVPGTG
jgi:hypothetical protein